MRCPGGLHWNGSTIRLCTAAGYVSITGVVSDTTCTGRGGQVDRFGNEQYFCNRSVWVNPSCGTPSGTCVAGRAGGREYFSGGAPYYATCNGTNWLPWATTACASACTGSYTWTDQTAAGSRSWTSIASSSDGSKLAAAVSGGDIYTSTDTRTRLGIMRLDQSFERDPRHHACHLSQNTSRFVRFFLAA